jgi:tubulin/ftsZ, GTPase
MRKDSVEMAIEVFVKNNDLTFVENIKSIEGVKDLTLIQYNGEYHG